MKTDAVSTLALPLVRSRVADYLALTKARVAVLVLFTVAVGFWLGARDKPADLAMLLHTVLATGLVAAGASAGLTVLDATQLKPSLETVFLNLTGREYRE